VVPCTKVYNIYYFIKFLL